jgi:hypothetical protein
MFGLCLPFCLCVGAGACAGAGATVAAAAAAAAAVAAAANLQPNIFLVFLQDADLVLVEYSLNGCRDPTGRALCSSAVMPRVSTASRMMLMLNQSGISVMMQGSCVVIVLQLDCLQAAAAAVAAAAAFSATGRSVTLRVVHMVCGKRVTCTRLLPAAGCKL